MPYLMGGANNDSYQNALDIQRLALAAFRADESGDVTLSKQLKAKMKELIKEI